MKIKNKTIKIILFIIFIIFISIIFSNKSNANTIYSINMYVNIIDNGDAQVVEIWDTYLDEGTEGYKSFANLGYSDITNFSVTDDTGIKYTEAFIWNTDSSFANKAYKYGKKCTNNSLELCWGISKYGHRVYTLQYVIKNFVTQFADAQGIYFNLLKMNQYVGNCNIKIHSNAIEFSPENSEIWCFGNDGTINFEGGDIVLRSNGELSSYEYMVPLIRFKENVYNIRTNISQKFFNDVYNEALYKSNNRGSFAKDIALVMYVVFLPLILMLIISIIKVKKNYNKIKFGSMNFGLGDRNLPIKIEYYRDIPCNGDIQKAYWLAFNYKIMSEKKVKEGIFGAYLLKWVKEKYIIINKNDNNLSRANKHNYTISFNNTPSLEDANERKLFNILKEAAGVNGILEPNELKKWCKTNYFKVALWFKDIDYCVKNKLEKEGYICTTVKEDKIFKDIFGKKLKSVSKKVNPELKKEVVQLLGFKKFLLDYSLIQEREYIEVELWEQYLMFAQLLGIAKKVQEQFSKVYPDFTNQLNFDINISNEIISDISHIYYYEADRRTISERITYSSSYSSGSGGDSFSGGGSSAGGSSGGGFR